MEEAMKVEGIARGRRPESPSDLLILKSRMFFVV